MDSIWSSTSRTCLASDSAKVRPDADVVADLRARYDIDQITGLH